MESVKWDDYNNASACFEEREREREREKNEMGFRSAFQEMCERCRRDPVALGKSALLPDVREPRKLLVKKQAFFTACIQVPLMEEEYEGRGWIYLPGSQVARCGIEAKQLRDLG